MPGSGRATGTVRFICGWPACEWTRGGTRGGATVRCRQTDGVSQLAIYREIFSVVGISVFGSFFTFFFFFLSSPDTILAMV